MRIPSLIRITKWLVMLTPAVSLVYITMTMVFIHIQESITLQKEKPELLIGSDTLEDSVRLPLDHEVEGKNYPASALHTTNASEFLQEVQTVTNKSLTRKTAAQMRGTEEEVLPDFVDSTNPNGPGEGGAPLNIDVKTLKAEDAQRYWEGWQNHHFNEYASQKISIHRSLPDCRSDVCKEYVQNFTGPLPEISVVIIFNNEAWTTLLRTVHSILARTPQHVLREIFLVDDKSTFDYLKAPLDKYFSAFPKVKIIRSPEKIGLTKARLLGFEASSAPVVVFLDAHIECFPGWSESMLVRIARNPTAVVFPVIDTIKDSTFQVSCAEKVLYYGTFGLKDLFFDWISIPEREKKRRQNDSNTYRSPTMPGGLFAIDREFFKKLGTYDPELDFWGGENIELSFKTWMCGGSLELDVCSRVSHVFRKGTTVKGSVAVSLKNSLRVAEVWMDDYKNYFQERLNYNIGDIGNVTSRLILRRNLQCKTFDWYIRNVFPEKLFPHGMKYAGEIRSQASPTCLDSHVKIEPVLFGCHNQGGNQIWYMGDEGHIHQDDLHVCVVSNVVVLQNGGCPSSGPQWEYREDKTIRHVPTGLCLTMQSTTRPVIVTSCNVTRWQRWSFSERRKDLNFPV